MIEKILTPVLKAVGDAVVKGTPAIFKSMTNHLVKHGSKYIYGAVAAVIGSAAYVVGNDKGHKKGKEEGTQEQAARDERKIKAMQQAHEEDRQNWKDQKQAYEDLLDEQ